MSYGFPIGRLNDMEAPVGTILGPTETNEWVVVSGHEGTTALISYATEKNLSDAKAYVKENGPRSVAEHRLFGWQA